MKRMGYETKRKWYGFSFILPWLIGCTLFFILPLIQTFGYAFQSLQASPTGFTATDVGWLNFEYLPLQCRQHRRSHGGHGSGPGHHQFRQRYHQPGV